MIIIYLCSFYYYLLTNLYHNFLLMMFISIDLYLFSSHSYIINVQCYDIHIKFLQLDCLIYYLLHFQWHYIYLAHSMVSITKAYHLLRLAFRLNIIRDFHHPLYSFRFKL